MITSAKQLEKSRLGRLLVNRGYINDQQLEEALHVQRTSGSKLGEVLIARGLISERDLARTLKHQTRYRYAAAFVAMVVTPLQPVVALAASANAQATVGTTSISQIKKGGLKSGLQPLSEEEMGGVTAQGLSEDVAQMIAQVELATESGQEGDKPEGREVLRNITKAVLVPYDDLIEYDLTVEGVTYNPVETMGVRPDGSIEVALPNIEKISIENIRVAGSTGPTFGDIYITDLQFLPESRMYIRTN